MINMNRLYPKENEYRTAVLLKLVPVLFLLFIIFISIIKSCIGSAIDPLDDSINKSREIVSAFKVVDSTYNGFDIVYTTKNAVTKERLEEIYDRPHIREAFQRLKTEAPAYFGNMVETDIYDFADFAVRHDPDPAIEIHNIFIFGKEKMRIYSQHNPKIENCATWIDVSTLQGVQYLSRDDIYKRREKRRRIYRYWKCFFPYDISAADERFSHFSEKQRIK